MDEIEVSLIQRRSAHGVLALVSRSFLLNIISFLAFLVISTQLLASDLGIYTAIIAIQRVISFFTDFGLGAALVQKKDEVSKDDIKTAFTLQALLTLAIFIVVFLLRNAITEFFNIGTSGQILLLVLVFSVFISSFKTIPSILLERKVNFQKLVIPQIGESLIFNIVLVVLLLKGSGLNSFSWAFLTSGLMGIPIYYYFSPWPLSIGISKDSVRHLKYGLQFQAKNVLATIKDDLLTVILAKILSFASIGYIGFAQRLSFFVYRYVVDSVTKVTFSTYSRIQESPEVLKKAIEKSIFFVSLAMFPILLGLIVTVPYFVMYFSKWNKWEPAVLSVVFFSLNALISSISGILINVLDATGKVKTTLKLMVFWTSATWILTPLLINYIGFNGVAIASFIVSLSVVYTVFLVKRIVKFQLLKNIAKPALSSLAMFVAVYFLCKLFVNSFSSLIIVIGIGGLIYTTIILSISRNEILSGIKIIRKNE